VRFHGDVAHFHLNVHLNSAATKTAIARFSRERKRGDLQRRDIFTAEPQEKIAEYGNCCDLWGTQWAERHSVDSVILTSP
jgi:hypothetical protein